LTVTDYAWDPYLAKKLPFATPRPKRWDTPYNLWLKNDLPAVVKGESETSQYALTNEGLIAQHCHGNTNHNSNILGKVWKAHCPQNDRRHHL
jgi:hypothetical protein